VVSAVGRDGSVGPRHCQLLHMESQQVRRWRLYYQSCLTMALRSTLTYRMRVAPAQVVVQRWSPELECFEPLAKARSPTDGTNYGTSLAWRIASLANSSHASQRIRRTSPMQICVRWTPSWRRTSTVRRGGCGES